MRTIEEVDTALEAFKLEGKKAKRERIRYILLAFALSAVALCYFYLVFWPAVEAYHEYSFDVIDDQHAERLRELAIERGENPPPHEPKAGTKPHIFLPSCGLVAIMVLFYGLLIKYRPGRKLTDRKTMYDAFREIRKKLEGAEWQEKARFMLQEELPKQRYSWWERFLLKHFRIYATIVIAVTAVMVGLMLAMIVWISSSLIFDPVLVFIVSFVAVTFVMKMVLHLLDARPGISEQDAKVNILAWIVSEPDTRMGSTLPQDVMDV
jgi:hypothetical protein